MPRGAGPWLLGEPAAGIRRRHARCGCVSSVPVQVSQITETDVSTPGLAERREEVGAAELREIASGDLGLEISPRDSSSFAVFLVGTDAPEAVLWVCPVPWSLSHRHSESLAIHSVFQQVFVEPLVSCCMTWATQN